jgi:hypothetical protein
MIPDTTRARHRAAPHDLDANIKTIVVVDVSGDRRSTHEFLTVEQTVCRNDKQMS